MTPPKNTQAAVIPCEEISLSNGAELPIEQRLYSELELEALLGIFFEHCQQILPIKGLRYKLASHDIDCRLGKRGQIVADFHLTWQNNAQGELILYGSNHLSTEHAAVLNKLSEQLILPVRNALSYETVLHNAMTDPLTGVANRAALLPAIDREIQDAKRHQVPLSILLIDLDDFKKINDHYGHTVGDKILQHVTQIFVQVCRQADIVFRYGGEEFIILLKHTPKSGSVKLAARLLKEVEQSPYQLDSSKVKATVSIGVATLTQYDSIESFISRADEAMYKAKRGGKNCCVFLPHKAA